MKKQIIIWIIIIIMIIIFASSASIYGTKITNNDENELLKAKVKEEINYLDSKILNMLNLLNNISLKNYIVKAQEINTQSSSDKSETSQKEGSSGGSQESSGGASGGEQSKQEQGSSGGESFSGGSSSKQEQNSQGQKTNTEMQYSSIIGSDRTPDWNTLKTDVENLYSSWSVIILDLYKLEINGEKILKFSSLLDNLTLNIKKEDKEKTLDTLTNMYSSLVGYANDFSNEDMYKSMLKTRENIFYAYAKIDSKKWDEVENRLKEAEKAYNESLDNLRKVEKEFNLNKGYILLKELQNSIPQQDEDVFYIKYKNLIEELNLLMS